MTASALDNSYILHPLGPFQVSSRGGVVVAHLVKFGHVVVRFDVVPMSQEGRRFDSCP